MAFRAPVLILSLALGYSVINRSRSAHISGDDYHALLCGRGVDRDVDCVCTRTRPCYPDIKLDLIIVGFPKCGTSSIAHALQHHPGIAYLGPNGTTDEDVFFQGRRGKAGYEVESYNAELAKAPCAQRTQSNASCLTFTKGPDYLYDSVYVLRFALIPNVRILIGIREPISWLESFVNYRRFERETNLELWRKGTSRILNKRVNQSVACPDGRTFPPPLTLRQVLGGCEWVGVSLQKAYFYIGIQNVLGVVPHRQVFITSVESLAAKPGAVLQQIRAWLGVPIGMDFAKAGATERRNTGRRDASNEYFCGNGTLTPEERMQFRCILGKAQGKLVAILRRASSPLSFDPNHLPPVRKCDGDPIHASCTQHLPIP